MDYTALLKLFGDQDKDQFTDIPSTGQDEMSRRKLVEDAVKARRWSLLPQAIGGVGDVLATANQAYGVNAPTNAMESIAKGTEERLGKTKTDFEEGLQTRSDSDLSKQYQNLLGRFLRKDPKQFSRMTAAQIKEQIPAIEKLANMENQRSMKEQTLSAQEEARRASAEDRKIARESLELNRQKLDEDRDLKRQLQEQQQLEGRVQKHATEMQKENLPELVSVYNRLAPVFESSKDVPGVGFLDSHVPGFLLSAEGKDTRSSLQKLANSLLKARSGAAVTDPEYRRFLLELQAGTMPTEEAMRSYLARMGQDTKTVIGQLEAGLPKTALEGYKAQPGAITSEDVHQFNPLPKKDASSGVPSVGGTYDNKKVVRVTRKK